MELRFCPELVYLRCQQSAFSEFFFFFLRQELTRGGMRSYTFSALSG